MQIGQANLQIFTFIIFILENIVTSLLMNDLIIAPNSSLLILILILSNMLLSARGKGTNKSHSKSKTPIKNDKTSAYLINTSPRKKRQPPKMDQTIKEKPISKQALTGVKYKTKQSYQILQNLEQIYAQLSFNEFDLFPIVMIENAKRNIEDLMTYLGHEPICRYHKDLLNIYCDHDKTVICVSCVYKTSDHKGHKIKSVESVEKVLDLQTIRSQQKTRNLIHQLSTIKDQIDFMTRQIGQSYMNISKYTISIVDQSIRELNAMKSDMEKKLSLAYRRTTTVINRYNDSLNLMINRLQKAVQQSVAMNHLSKYLLLKEITKQDALIENLINKFNQNKQMMNQWHKSNADFEKIVIKMRDSITQKIDSFVVTQF